MCVELGEIGVYIGAYLWVVFDKLCSYVDTSAVAHLIKDAAVPNIKR
jgi:hypothetical protein